MVKLILFKIYCSGGGGEETSEKWEFIAKEQCTESY